MTCFVRRHSITTSLALCGLLLVAGADTGTAAVFSLGPQDTFLHVHSFEQPASPAVIVDLAALGVGPGDVIQVEQLGDFIGISGGNDDQKGVHGVFSSSSTLTSESNAHRVPGAVTSVNGVPIVTVPTCPNNPTAEATDIPEDFWISGPGATDSPPVNLVVPSGATHLFVGVPDCFYLDNSDPNSNLAVRVELFAKVPTLSTWGLVAFGAALLGLSLFAVARRRQAGAGA